MPDIDLGTYPLIPWEPVNIPSLLQNELDRRKINRSFNYIAGEQGDWLNDTGNWSKYKGPMVPWIRVCSNGMGRQLDNKGDPLDSSQIKPGFVLFGGKNFYDSYGFNINNKESNPSIIGYIPNNNYDPHVIDNDLNTSDYPIHVAPPEIERLHIIIQKEHFRKATLNWVCFSKKQLEYMTPYFLIPHISCIMEWGWNLYDPTSLVDLRNIGELKNLHNNQYYLYTKHILKSRGNYDVLFGIITHFDWSIDGNKIRCTTEISSPDRIYSGLIINSTPIYNDKTLKVFNPLGKLTDFIDRNIMQFKTINSVSNPESIESLKNLVLYIKKHHKYNWKDYIYGIFYGRDMQDKKNPFQESPDKKEDFDYKNGKNEELWINFGLLIEIINFHASALSGMKNSERFRIDIDDVVITGHPNLISADGNVCLIPNAESPKYFYGLYGPNLTKSKNYNPNDWKKLQVSTEFIKVVKKSDAEKLGKLADFRLHSICLQQGGAYRDNLDEIINEIRYEHTNHTKPFFEFPFSHDRYTTIVGAKPYPARYSGYLKNIYVNVSFLKDILNKSDDVKTYSRFIEKILDGISSSCSNFWDFRLISAMGAYNVPDNQQGTMKIIDYKFMHFANKGQHVFTFDYMDADSLLMGLEFKPTLGYGQAIRAIFAPTNNPNKSINLINGVNELLNYHFKDRLIQDDDNKNKLPEFHENNDSFKETMRELQQLIPPVGSYQITNKENNKIIVRRLALPDPEILQMLLDDGDSENNPQYTGIMPGIQAKFTIQGMGGLRTFMMFLVRNLPEPYSEKNIIFRIIDIEETIESGGWVTVITAGIIPLRGYIKRRLGITDKKN